MQHYLTSERMPKQKTLLTRSANAMEVRLPEFGEIEVDHHIHSLYINSSCEEI